MRTITKATLAGTDVECGYGYAYKSIPEAVRRGLITEAEVDKHVIRLLEGRFDLGEMDDPSLVEWSKIPYSAMSTKASVEFPLGRMWQGKRIRFGMPTVFVPRLFRFGLCRYGDMEMDERLIPDSGRTIRFRSVFIDDNLNGLDWWKAKHRNYAEREARQALGGVRGKKSLYYKIPPYARAVAYWLIRYLLFCGFLDGRAGWNWNFWQGLWYRCLVDKNILRMKRENACKK